MITPLIYLKKKVSNVPKGYIVVYNKPVRNTETGLCGTLVLDKYHRYCLFCKKGFVPLKINDVRQFLLGVKTNESKK